MPGTTTYGNRAGVGFGNANNTGHRTVVRFLDRTTRVRRDLLRNSFRNATTLVERNRLGACFPNRTTDVIRYRLVFNVTDRTTDRERLRAIVGFPDDAGYRHFAGLVDIRDLGAISRDLLLLVHHATSRLHDGVAATSSSSACASGTTGSVCRTGHCSTALICGSATTTLCPGSAC